MPAKETGTRHGAIAVACLGGALAIAALAAEQNRIRIQPTIGFLEALFRDMAWTWSVAGFLVSVIGCIAAEKARNRGASGLVMGPLAALCFVLALIYAMALAAGAVEGGLARILQVFR